MSTDFYENELRSIQITFNQAFSEMPLCNPKIRIIAIFGIVQMGLLERKIKQEDRKEDVRKFFEIKEKLTRIFVRLTKEKGDRHENQESRNG